MRPRTILGLVCFLAPQTLWAQDAPTEDQAEAAPDGVEASEEEAPAEAEEKGEDSNAEASEEAAEEPAEPDAAAEQEADSETKSEEAEEAPAAEGSGAAADEPAEKPAEAEAPAAPAADEPAPAAPGEEFRPSKVTARSSKVKAQEEGVDSVSLAALMETKVVAASKTAESIADAPSNVQVITSQQIREWGARDLKDVLRRIPGFPVIPDRDEWVFGARGSLSDNNQKYLILIDGHRMNSWENFGPGQVIELPNDLSNVERIEIIRGPGSAVWGADALAGVINLVTKSARDLDGDTAHVQATVGMNGMYRGNAQVGHEYDDDVELMLMGAYAQEGGVSVTQSAATGLPVLGEESGYSEHPFGTYTTALEKRRPGFMLQAKGRVKGISVNAYHLNNQVFNRHFESDAGRENYLTSEKYFIEAAANEDWQAGSATLKFWTHQNRNEYMPLKQGSESKLPINIVWLDRGFGTGLDVRHQVTKWLNLSGGIDFQFTRFGPNQRINAVNPEEPTTPTEGYWFDPYKEDRQLGGYLQTRSVFFDKKLQLILGARFDYNPDRGDSNGNINPRGGIIYQPVEETALKLLYNRGFLRPANFQNAGEPVDAEVMDQGEFIWLQKIGPVSTNVTAFAQRLSGSINILAGDFSGFANSGDVHSYGTEIMVEAPIAQHTAWVNGSYTYTTAKNFDDSLPLNSQRVDPDGKVLSVPNITANAGLTLRFLSEDLYITPMFRVVGESVYRASPPVNSIDDAIYDTSGPFYYVDLTAGYNLSRTWTLSAHGFNLTNVTTPQALSIWNGTIEQQGVYVEGRVQARF